jgi:hypothetical protein
MRSVSAECFRCNYLGKTESFYQIVTCLSHKILRKFYLSCAPLYYVFGDMAIFSIERLYGMWYKFCMKVFAI